MKYTFEWLDAEHIWLGVGLLGQALFFMRFFVQWIASERQKKSIIPKAFWYFSLAGGVTLFSYAVYRRDPVFILGQSTGLFIYLRNIYFVTVGSGSHAKAKAGIGGN
ncbi:lipid-A-disaccharide synthase N-terminal domain-containing protein [Sneathiella limimaris]|uniref:lipid-A-disaccharide synthase N-terminal domain-containing protein n=1 Tax=Sneathiella limimaris TaxID=1964213 RepID=UPI00146A6A9F|nr:lipid-A-disaccharide synthase N-terminal domain-containing protein [Sneathiella limimaris]